MAHEQTVVALFAAREDAQMATARLIPPGTSLAWMPQSLLSCFQKSAPNSHEAQIARA